MAVSTSMVPIGTPVSSPGISHELPLAAFTQATTEAGSNVAGTSTETPVTPVAGNSTATQSNPSNLPYAGILNWGAAAVNGWYYATDPNDSHFQIGYNPSTGSYDYSNPYTGGYDSGLKSWPTSLAAAIQDYEQVNGNAPAATIAAFLNGTGFSSTPSAAAAASTPAATTTTTTTDPIVAALAPLLSGLLSTNSGSGSSGLSASDPDSSPTILPTSTGTQSTGGANPVVVVVLLVIAGAAMWYWWKHRHHHAAA